MKIRVKMLTDVEILAIKCEMAVRYEEEDIPNDFPLREGDMWVGIIDIETGIIRDWPKGKSGKMSMKVCDEGTYTLLGQNDIEIIQKVNDYVPSCIPSEYGDYVMFDIDVNGNIADWKNYCTEENIVESFYDEE